MFVKNKFYILYFFLIGCASVGISLFFNPEQKIVNSHNRPYVKYPEPTFFEFENIKTSDIQMPELKDIKQFRGDGRRLGYYEIKFDPDNLIVETKKTINAVNFGAHGASKSSPIDSDNFIVLAGDYGLIQVLNKSDHSLHWKIELFDSVRGIHGTPITFSDYAFLADYSGNLYFLNLIDKKIIWIIDLGDALGATPYFDGHYLYLNIELSGTFNGYIAKLDPFAKKIIWRSRLIGEQSHSSPAFNNDSLFLGDNSGDFFKMSSITGKIVWKKFLGQPIKSTANLFSNRVTFSTWDKMIYCLDQNSGSLLWTYNLPNENQSSLAVDEKSLIGFINSSEGLHKIDLKNGKSLGDYKMEMSSGSKRASPIILKYKNKKRVATACNLKSVCMYDFDTLKLLKEYRLDEEISNQIGVLDNALIVTGNMGLNYLYLYSQVDPKL